MMYTTTLHAASQAEAMTILQQEAILKHVQQNKSEVQENILQEKVLRHAVTIQNARAVHQM